MKKINNPKKNRIVKKILLSLCFTMITCSEVFCQNTELDTDMCQDRKETKAITVRLYQEATFGDSLHTLNMYIDQKIKALIKNKHPEIENVHWFVSFIIDEKGRVIRVSINTDTEEYKYLNEIIGNIFSTMPIWNPPILLVGEKKINGRQKYGCIIKF